LEKNRAKSGKKPKKPSQTGKNRVKPEKPSQTVFVLQNRTETGRFEPTGFGSVSDFFKKNLVWLLFYIKTKPN